MTWAAGVGATGDQLLIAVYVNGVAYKEMQYYAYSTGTQKTHISAQVDINAVTDTIEIYARQTNGASATRDIVGNASDTWFMSSLIGRIA